MKKLLLCAALASTSFCFASESSQDISTSAVTIDKQITVKPKKTMDAASVKKGYDKPEIQTIDQPKQEEQLVGSNPETWTPKYLDVKNYKKCLGIQEYRGWEGYCMPTKRPSECPKKSWDTLQEMNLVPCSKD